MSGTCSQNMTDVDVPDVDTQSWSSLTKESMNTAKPVPQS
jgi:hypothetical protein